MPRYPNVWFYVDASLAASYESAVKLVTDRLRQTMGLSELFGPFDNSEGCDFETRLEHLQPWHFRSAPALQHSHAFHMRYYYSALAKHKAGEVTLRTTAGTRPFFRFAASAHYEVEHTNPNHADVESCPICGRTGAYRSVRQSGRDRPRSARPRTVDERHSPGRSGALRRPWPAASRLSCRTPRPRGRSRLSFKP